MSFRRHWASLRDSEAVQRGWEPPPEPKDCPECVWNWLHVKTCLDFQDVDKPPGPRRVIPEPRHESRPNPLAKSSMITAGVAPPAANPAVPSDSVVSSKSF